MNNPKEEAKIKIGLEVHVTIKNLKKIFNMSETFNNENGDKIRIEPWELGYLGTLPILNNEAIESAIKMCLSLNSRISKKIDFDRKIYSYFDLSKGFQITQQNNPIGQGGHLPILIDREIENIPIKRIQLEEDTAKSSYCGEETMLDFNRSGNPLIEIVTDPVFDNIKTLLTFVKQLQSLLRYLDISDAKMEKGQFRVDLNFSFSFSKTYHTPRYEVKNLNSFKNLKISLEQEFEKHYRIFKESNCKKCNFESESLGFDESSQKTFVQRTKSSYCYLSEVNIPTIKVSSREIKKIEKKIPIYPWEIWKKINKITNLKNSYLIFEKPFFLKFINLFDNKKIDYAKEFDFLASFLFNHVFNSLKNLSDEKILLFTKKHFNLFWKIFICWKEKTVPRSLINPFIIDFFSTKKNHSTLVEKIKKEEEDKDKFIDFNVLKQEVRFILNNDIISERIISQPAKLTHFLLGKLKTKFPRHSINFNNVQDLSIEESNRLSDK